MNGHVVVVAGAVRALLGAGQEQQLVGAVAAVGDDQVDAVVDLLEAVAGDPHLAGADLADLELVVDVVLGDVAVLAPGHRR